MTIKCSNHHRLVDGDIDWVVCACLCNMSTYYNDEKQFDADKFRYSYTSLTGSDPGLRSLLLEQLCQLHEFYSVAFQCGAFQFGSCRMLEYGGGPSQVHPLVSATPYCSEIVFAEYAEHITENCRTVEIKQ